MITIGLWSYLGDNCIQHFHLGRYMVRFTVGNLVLQPGASWAIKCDFPTYIRQYTSQNEDFEYGYPHSNALLQFRLETERWRHTSSNEMWRNWWRRTISCCKYLMLSNQRSHYKSKCIRIKTERGTTTDGCWTPNHRHTIASTWALG